MQGQEPVIILLWGLGHQERLDILAAFTHVPRKIIKVTSSIFSLSFQTFLGSSERETYEIQPEKGTVALNSISNFSFQNKSIALTNTLDID